MLVTRHVHACTCVCARACMCACVQARLSTLISCFFPPFCKRIALISAHLSELNRLFAMRAAGSGRVCVCVRVGWVGGEEGLRRGCTCGYICLHTGQGGVGWGEARVEGVTCSGLLGGYVGHGRGCGESSRLAGSHHT